MNWTRRKLLAILVIFALLVEPINSRRGGGGGFGRGSSAGRSSGGFGRSRGGGGGGIFGGSRNTGSNSRPSGTYSSGSSRSGGGGLFSGSSGNSQSRNKGGGIFGGFGSNKQNYRQPQTSSWRPSGIGSRSRSSTFKNMIVGAAAGYLTYQAGKHLIRSAMAPMMWNNRPYYWGQSYYQPRPQQQMCRMPLDPGDPQFGNIYFQDQTRPKEIVWSCGYNEQCCGYECCPGGGYGGGGYGSGGYGGGGYYGRNGYSGIGIGTLLVLLIVGSLGAFTIFKVCQNVKNNKYQRGRPTDAPPVYNNY
ncbi:unnamed protein product [Bursaphelenchus okinawaensis]|uniref:CX domain-containing protein n=1 Tax=Bursaphelenchus okinawaensis TaxID=465554 RepID=A0A811KE89_9BILA|nr:unnamed protein product [Bursaphelenchus okinawaensis]CAG9101605.1 unnamed protein product [Bursaphelenchus okinawaensis]